MILRTTYLTTAAMAATPVCALAASGLLTASPYHRLTVSSLASVTIGPIQFDTPIWLWLIPIGWALSLWIGRRSLSGLGTATRRVALAVRLLVILLLAAAMAEP